MALIGEDCSISITFGTVVAGVITYGSALVLTGTARKVTTTDSVELANTKAIGDGRKKHRPHSGMTRVEIEGVTPYAGFQMLTSRVSPIGLACKMALKELSSLSTPFQVAGVCETWVGEIADGEPTLEKCTIVCDIDAS